MTLTEKQMIKIIKDKKITSCSKEEQKQVMAFAFGQKFMSSNDKGKLKKYTDKGAK
tara:strand:+ start:377 stop:544 length:168 start_codon:yes stop_codon:yes gene_type:complete